MKNEQNDADAESLDKIEILETIDDAKNFESGTLDYKTQVLELKRKKLKLKEMKDQEEKVLQEKRAEISIRYLSERISKLLKVVREVKPAKDLTDYEIEYILPEADEKWENAIEELRESKVELAKELIGLKLEESAMEEIDANYDEVVAAVKEKLSDLKAADNERGLFALSEPPMNLAIYPEPFHGKPGENIYKFFDKMKDALDWNQVKEKHRVNVLVNHLGGAARDLVDDLMKHL